MLPAGKSVGRAKRMARQARSGHRAPSGASVYDEPAVEKEVACAHSQEVDGTNMCSTDAWRYDPCELGAQGVVLANRRVRLGSIRKRIRRSFWTMTILSEHLLRTMLTYSGLGMFCVHCVLDS